MTNKFVNTYKFVLYSFGFTFEWSNYCDAPYIIYGLFDSDICYQGNFEKLPLNWEFV